MALLTKQQTSQSSGITISTTGAAAGGDSFVNTGQEFLYVDNQDTADHTVTVAAQHQCNQGFTHDIAVTVTAGTQQLIGPFDKSHYNDANQQVQITYDAVTSVNVGVVELG